ncbi:MAG: diaminopimelate epimerase [Alphaproteobacteria bacterium]|jgi:diaminopimelate epimerase|nr:diaminopimelate epimerase [Alphaproteobacteria bacterium]
MGLAFRKMHGAGNDFVILDARTTPVPITPDGARWLANRNLGVGAEQIIRLEPSAQADVFMRILNPDGSEAGACGNATRCVARMVFEETGRDHAVVQTIAGLLPARALPDGEIEVDMGPARLDWAEVPLARAMDTLHLPLALGPVSDPAACSMGNPHATFFVADLTAIPVAEIGPLLERDALFPDRANIGFAQILARDDIRLVMWERGAGMTMACGSGACATIVNAARRGLTGRRARIRMPGGDLRLQWCDGGHVLMAGPTALSFMGELDAARLAA